MFLTFLHILKWDVSYPLSMLGVHHALWAYGVVLSMFDFHRSDRGSNPSHGGKIHNVYDYIIERHP